MPDVSVVMAVRDGARYLRAAVDSVLAQTVGDLELVVVDDASTDASRDILAGCPDPRLVVVHNDRHLGLTPSLNRGLARARAALVARHDADDVSHPERLARQIMAIEAVPRLALVGSQGGLIDAEGRRVGRLNRPLDPHGIRWYQMFDSAFVHGAVMFRRAVVVDELGGYDESFVWAQDWELWGRILERYEGRNLPDRLVEYRTHAGSVTVRTTRDPDRQRDYVRRNVSANVRRALGLTLPPAEIELLCGFLLGLSRADVGRYLALVDRLVGLFHAAHPAAAARGEPARTLAVQLDALAARAHPAGRATAFAVYACALRQRPALVRRLPLPHVIARLALGPRVIAWLQARGFGRPVPQAAGPREP